MAQTRTAKLFQNGASQAVRLPADFRFEGQEVFIRRDEVTGDVVLSKRPSAGSWTDFFALLGEIDVPADFMAGRPLNVPPRRPGVFDDQVQPKHKAKRKRL
jgi:antitoxin VapB